MTLNKRLLGSRMKLRSLDYVSQDMSVFPRIGGSGFKWPLWEKYMNWICSNMAGAKFPF